MPRLSVSDTVAKWKANSTTLQAQQYYTAGVKNPRHDWETATAAAEAAWQAGIQLAIQRGTRVKGVQAAGTGFWASQTLAKAGNWQTGIMNGGTKATAGFNRLFGYIAQADQAVANMPRATRAERIARASAYLTAVGAAHDADTTRT